MNSLCKVDTYNYATGSYVWWELCPKVWEEQGIYKQAYPKEMQWCATGLTLNTYEKPLQRWNADVYYDKYGNVLGVIGLGGVNPDVLPNFAPFFKSLKNMSE